MEDNQENPQVLTSENQLEKILNKQNPQWHLIPERFKFASQGEALKKFSIGDKLTEIPAINNEVEFRKWEEEMVAQSLSKGRSVARVDMDLVQLGFLNEAFGRDTGDTVVKHGIAKVSQALNEVFSKENFQETQIYIFREHARGDEIVVYLFNLPQGERAEILEKLHELSQKINKPSNPLNLANSQGKNIEITLTTSLGYAYSEEPLVRKNLGLVRENSDKTLRVQELIRELARTSERRTQSRKLMADVQRLNGEILKATNPNEIIERIVERFGDGRISDSILDNLLISASVKAAQSIDFETFGQKSEFVKWNEELSKALSQNPEKKQTIISAVRKKFFEIFRPKLIQQTEEKTHKTYEEYKKLMEKQFGSEWNNISPAFRPTAGQDQKNTCDEILENDSNSLDSRLNIAFYSTKTKELLAQKLTQAISERKNFLVGSIDANSLKKANLDGGYALGNVFIERHAAIVSNAFDPTKLGLSENCQVYLASRDAAGDEFFIFVFNPDETDIEKIKTASQKLNEVRENLAYNGKRVLISTSSAFVTSDILTPEDFQEESGRETTGIKFKAFDKLIQEADSRVKLIKTIFELENLPLEALIGGKNIYDAIRLVRQNFSGGRIRKNSLELIVKTVAVRAAFDYCIQKNIDYQKSWNLFYNLFASIKEKSESEDPIDKLKYHLFTKLEEAIGQKYGSLRQS